MCHNNRIISRYGIQILQKYSEVFHILSGETFIPSSAPTQAEDDGGGRAPLDTLTPSDAQCMPGVI